MGKLSRRLLVVGVSEPQALDSFEVSAKEAGAEMVALGSAEEALEWLEDHDPVAIALDMMAEGAEQSCFGIRGIARLAQVPIIGLAPELNDLAFPEMYGWGGDDVIRVATPLEMVPRLRGLATDSSLEAPPSKGGAVVVDVDRRRRALYARVLRNAGYDVRFAVKTEEACAESVAEGVKLVIADAEFGDEGGVGVAKRIRAGGSEVPIVIASAPKKMAGYRAEAEGIAKLAVTDGFAPPENLLFVANELGRSGATDGRASARLLYGTVVAFRVAGRDADAFGCTYNISAGGLYVRTLAPLDRGQEVWIELIPPRSDRRVRLEGKVVWRRRFGPIESATVPPGFGLQITDATKGDMARYEAGYKAFAADTVGAADAG
jgi:DNA-binding response OmpR family regulator/Tfp pilus assembly protein PilZ